MRQVRLGLAREMQEETFMQTRDDSFSFEPGTREIRCNSRLKSKPTTSPTVRV